jgi:hypothetical protein
MGKGAPVDEIDKACLEYKNCLACTTMTLNDNNCVPELVGYSLEAANVRHTVDGLQCRK